MAVLHVGKNVKSTESTSFPVKKRFTGENPGFVTL